MSQNEQPPPPPPDLSVFDAYACAALTGLLANAAITTGIEYRAMLTSTEGDAQRHLVLTAMHYARLSMLERPQQP